MKWFTSLSPTWRAVFIFIAIWFLLGFITIVQDQMAKAVFNTPAAMDFRLRIAELKHAAQNHDYAQTLHAAERAWDSLDANKQTLPASYGLIFTHIVTLGDRIYNHDNRPAQTEQDWTSLIAECDNVLDH